MKAPTEITSDFYPKHINPSTALNAINQDANKAILQQFEKTVDEFGEKLKHTNRTLFSNAVLAAFQHCVNNSFSAALPLKLFRILSTYDAKTQANKFKFVAEHTFCIKFSENEIGEIKVKCDTKKFKAMDAALISEAYALLEAGEFNKLYGKVKKLHPTPKKAKKVTPIKPEHEKPSEVSSVNVEETGSHAPIWVDSVNALGSLLGEISEVSNDGDLKLNEYQDMITELIKDARQHLDGLKSAKLAIGSKLS